MKESHSTRGWVAERRKLSQEGRELINVSPAEGEGVGVGANQGSCLRIKYSRSESINHGN